MTFKDIVPIIVATLGALLGLLSVLFASRVSRGDFLGRRELEFRERQLSEFYGPVYGYLKSQKDLYEMWMNSILDEKNFEIKQLFVRQNTIVRNLIISKVHLIDSADMPEFFVRYLSNTIIWDMYAGTTPDGMVPNNVKVDPRAAYPQDFNEHIFSTTVRLKERTEALNARFAISLSRTTSEPEA